jgi:translocation and assembly module TamB
MPTTAADKNTTPKSRPPSGPRRRWLWIIAAALAALIVLLVVVSAWMVSTTTGLRTALSVAARVAPGSLTVEGVTGTIRSPLTIAKLRFENTTLRIEANDIVVDVQSRGALSRQLIIDSAKIRNITLATKPSNELAKIPVDLTLPISLDVRALSVEKMRVEAWEAAAGLQPITLTEFSDIQARVQSDGRFHKISDAALTTALGRIAAGVVLDGASPFNIAAALKLNGNRDDKTYAIKAEATGTLDAIAVAANATGWNLSGDAKLKVTPFASVPVERATINMGEINPAAFSAGAPKAALTLRANLVSRLDAQNEAKQNIAVAASDWILSGPIEVTNREPAALDRGGIPVTSLRANAEWKNAELALQNLVLATDAKSAATVTGSAKLRNRIINAQLKVLGLDPRDWVSTLKPARLNGDIALTASETAQSVDVKLIGPVNNVAPWRAELVAAHKDGEIDINSIKLISGDASLNGRGRLSLAKNRVFSLTGGLVNFDPARFADVPRAKLNADFNAAGELKPELTADVKFDLRDSVVFASDSAHALTGRGDVRLTPSRLARADVTLDFAGNKLDANGAWGGAGDKLKFSIAAPRLDTLGLGLSGKLDATGELTGTFAAPSGEINANASALLLSPSVKIDQASLRAKLSDGLTGPVEGVLKVSGINRESAPPGKSPATTLVEQVDATLSGTRAAHALRLTARISENENIVLGLNGALASSLPSAASSSLTWQGNLDRLDIKSRVANLVLAQPAPLSLSRDQVKLGLTELRSASVAVAANAKPSPQSSRNNASAARIRFVETEWSPQTQAIRARGDMSGLQMNSVPGSGGGAKSTSANIAKLTLGADWDVRATDRLNGSVRVFRESGDVMLPGETAISPGLTDLEIKLVAVQNQVAATLLAKGEKFGLLNGAGSFEVQRSGSLWQLARARPIALEARADMASVSWLGPLIDPALQLTGNLRGELKVTGTGAEPRAVGSLRGTALTAAWPDEGFRLTNGEVVIDFVDNRAKLSQFSFRADPSVRPREGRIEFADFKATPGTLTGSGDLALADGKGIFKFTADKLALIQRANRWLMLSGDVTATTAWDAVSVAGKLRADAGYFELAGAAPPRLSDDVVIRGRAIAADKAVRFSVDIDIDLGNQLYFNGRGLSTRLAGGLRLRAEPKSALRVLGSVSASGGTFDAYGQYLNIERGILNFQGPLETAGLNVLALRKGLAVEAGVEITGTVADPRVRLVSEPNVPDTEKLSWIVVGRGQDQAGSSDSALLLSAATAILGGSSDSLPRQIAQGLGFDQLTVSSGSLGGNQSSLPTTTAAGSTASSGGSGGSNSSANLASQIVTLGKRLSANAYVSYEQSLAGASSVVKLTYNLSRRVSVIGRAGTDNSIDLSYTFSFD